MKKPFIFVLGVCLFTVSACGNGKGHFTSNEVTTQKIEKQSIVKLTLMPQGSLEIGKPTTVFAKLNSLPDQSIISDDDLAIVHTRKFHLLVADPTLTDYQHIHPQLTTTPGLYSFAFTPKLSGGYRAWADVTPVTTHKQEFTAADLGAPKSGGINKTETHETVISGYRFTLAFDTPPTMGNASMGMITVTDQKGKPVTSLEPVMGAFAHIVGFYEDFRTVVHTHPMGKEPDTIEKRGGPELMFHLEPAKAGFIKLFAQVKIDGKEIFVPFGVNVSSGEI